MELSVSGVGEFSGDCLVCQGHNDRLQRSSGGCCGSVCVRISPRWAEQFFLHDLSQAVEAQKDQEPCPFVLDRADVGKSFKRVNPHKAPVPDGILGCVLRVCAVQLAEVFTDICSL